MATVNKRATGPPVRTHEGGPAKRITPLQELERSVLACLLWEDSFYESGEDIATRTSGLVQKVDPKQAAALAVQARLAHNLRHAPLWIARSLAAKGYEGLGDLLPRVIDRPDELTEFLAIYWMDGKQPLSYQVKKGLAQAFAKFDEYQLAKYNRKKEIALKDVMRLVHPRPRDQEQRELWGRLINDQLATPDTWEVALSGGADKRGTFERLIRENKLGGLALLRNLRNMEQAGVDPALIRKAILTMNTRRILPFRFVAAARYAPRLELALEDALLRSLKDEERLAGKTVVLVDVSGSMGVALSSRSDMTRVDAAAALAMILRELAEEVEVYTFSQDLVVVPPRHGFALRDAVIRSQAHGGTCLGGALQALQGNTTWDRIVVVSDEQAHDSVGHPGGKAYMLNVGTYQNGVGYGRWIQINGFSEAIVRYVIEAERAGL